MTDDIEAMVKKSQEIVELCSVHLTGHGPMIQGAALADLVALWLAGVQGEDAPSLRKHMLASLVKTIRGLTKVNSEMVLDREMKRARAETKQ